MTTISERIANIFPQGIENSLVLYLANKSKIKRDKMRKFIIIVVEKISMNENGVFFTAKVWDVDDAGKQKTRTLHLDSIEQVA